MPELPRSHGRRMSWVNQPRPGESSIINAIFAGGLLLPLALAVAGPLPQLPEFAPPQIIFSKDLVPLLLAPWASPSTIFRVLSRLIQAALLFHLPGECKLPCYYLWIAVGLVRTLVGFVLSRSVGWAYPRMFNHWALYESSGGLGPALVTYLLASRTRPEFDTVLNYFRGRRWEVTDSLLVLVICVLLAALDASPWTYAVAIGLALLVNVWRAVLARYYTPDTAYTHPGEDSHLTTSPKRLRADIQISLILLALLPLPSIIAAAFGSKPTLQMPSSLKEGAPFLEIIILSYPRPNDVSSSDSDSILSQTIASYLPHVSSSTSLSVFTHAKPIAHPSFMRAQQHFKDTPITFYADGDTHADMHEGQYLHLAEAFRWAMEKGPRAAEWIMIVEDDFPLCGEWGWDGVLGVMNALERERIASPEQLSLSGGFVGTGGSGLIIHQTLLPILAHTLRLHAAINSPLPAFLPRRPADIIVQDCLLGADPLCPATLSSKEASKGKWFASRKPSMVITSRLIMDHTGGNASTAKGRAYDMNKWRCGWRHPFHGRPEVKVIPV